jgi:hypothetical protein
MSQTKYSGIYMQVGIRLRHNEMLFDLQLEDNMQAGLLQIRGKKPISPVELEMALYQFAHAVAEYTRTGKQLREEKGIWS